MSSNYKMTDASKNHVESKFGEINEKQMNKSDQDDATRVRILKRQISLKYCIVMPRKGDTLFSIVNKLKCKLSIQSIVSIGLQLLGSLEKMHGLGFVHNDLKPDNVLVGDVSWI